MGLWGLYDFKGNPIVGYRLTTEGRQVKFTVPITTSDILKMNQL